VSKYGHAQEDEDEHALSCTDTCTRTQPSTGDRGSALECAAVLDVLLRFGAVGAVRRFVDPSPFMGETRR
jgi:hypothetical protein